MNYLLKYREPGVRPDSTRWAFRPVESVKTAIQWMNENKDRAYLPAFVLTKGWGRRQETVAILGSD